jgi:hypothetical protein
MLNLFFSTEFADIQIRVAFFSKVFGYLQQVIYRLHVGECRQIVYATRKYHLSQFIHHIYILIFYICNKKNYFKSFYVEGKDILFVVDVYGALGIYCQFQNVHIH